MELVSWSKARSIFTPAVFPWWLPCARKASALDFGMTWPDASSMRMRWILLLPIPLACHARAVPVLEVASDLVQ